MGDEEGRREVQVECVGVGISEEDRGGCGGLWGYLEASGSMWNMWERLAASGSIWGHLGAFGAFGSIWQHLGAKIAIVDGRCCNLLKFQEKGSNYRWGC